MSEARPRAAEDWAADTPLPGLRAALDRLAPDAADGVAALVRPVLEDTAWLDRLVADFVAMAGRDIGWAPPLPAFDSGVQHGVLLYGDARVGLFLGTAARDRLAAKRLRSREGAIVVPGTLGLIRVLRGGGARLSLWEGGWRDGALLPACRAAGMLHLRDGETITLDGRTTGFVVEHVTGDTLLLQATVNVGVAPTLCEYDAGTLALAGVGAARDGASRAQLLATLLAEIGHVEPQAFTAASHLPEPYARWHAMRLWSAADGAGAAPRLAEMAAGDPDPELRDLAARTLALVSTPCPA